MEYSNKELALLFVNRTLEFADRTGGVVFMPRDLSIIQSFLTHYPDLAEKYYSEDYCNKDILVNIVNPMVDFLVDKFGFEAITTDSGMILRYE